MAGGKRSRKKIARQANNAGSPKRAPSVDAPPATKRVGAAVGDLPSAPEGGFRWSATQVDHGYHGSWDWDLAPEETREFLCFLEDMSKLSWAEIRLQTTGTGTRRRKLHHSQPSASLCREARQRLADLEIDDEELFRMRHGGELRIWGRLFGSTFHIVWYDRKHKVYPQDKK